MITYPLLPRGGLTSEDSRRRRTAAPPLGLEPSDGRPGGGLLADPAVDALAQQVGVSAVPRLLLDHVHQQVA